MEIVVKKPEIIIEKIKKAKNKRIIFIIINLVLIFIFIIGRVLDYTTTKYGLSIGLRDLSPFASFFVANPLIYFILVLIFPAQCLLAINLTMVKNKKDFKKYLSAFLIFAIVSILPVIWNFIVLSENPIVRLPVTILS